MSLKTGNRWLNWAWDKLVKASYPPLVSDLHFPSVAFPHGFLEDSLPQPLLGNNSINEMEGVSELRIAC